MDDIYFYTPEFELLHIEANITSVQWSRKYADAGTMELHTDTESGVIAAVLPSSHSDVIFVQGGRAAWVHGMTDISDDKSDIMVNGKTLEHMLRWRAVNPFEATNTVENIIRAKITQQYMTPGSGKYLPSFALAPAIGGTSSVTYVLKDKQKSLFDVVQELCKMDNLGFAVDCDAEGGHYLFRLYRGVDRSADQSAVPPVILSEDDRTLADAQYYYKADEYATCGYAAVKDDETDEVTYTEVVKDAASGFYRRESVLTAASVSEAEAELAKAAKVEQVDGEADGVRYGTDYGLGDIVTVQKRIGGMWIAQNKRVTEIIEVFEPLNTYERPILDEEG